jgi:hypothetical protein
MSAKKVSPKKAVPVKKAPAKAPAKKAVPVKKAAPAKKVVAKKKPVEIKSSAKKTKTPVAAVKKSVPMKKAAPAKKADVAKSVPSKKKETVKEVLKVSTAKKTPTKKPLKEEEKSSKKIKKVSSNKSAVSPKPSKADTKKLDKKVAEKKSSAKKEKKIVETVVSEEQVEKKEKATKPGKKDNVNNVPEVALAKLLPAGKKPSKVVLFFEIDEQEDRLNKKKVSAEMKGLEKPTAAMRRKASLAEETPEELYQRVIQELEEKNQSFYREAATQVCTKCCVNIVSPEFRVDKDLGYCEDCAMLLGLGFTKEARKVDYQMGLMGGDSLDEDRDEDIDEKAPSIEELEDEDFDIDE